MRHARLVAEITMYAARANRETALDGWLCDWGYEMSRTAREAESIEQEIKTALDSANYFESEDGPGEEDGPWAEGWEKRSSGAPVILSNDEIRRERSELP